MDDDILKQDVGSALAGNDNELLDPIEVDDNIDDLDDGLVDQELENELDETLTTVDQKIADIQDKKADDKKPTNN